MSIWDRFNKDEESEWKELITFEQHAESIPESIHLQYYVSTGMIHIRERDNTAIEPEIYDVISEVISSYIDKPATANTMVDMAYEISSKLQRFVAEGRVRL